MIYFNDWLEEQKKIEDFKEECFNCNEKVWDWSHCYIFEDGTALYIDKDKISNIVREYFGESVLVDDILKNKGLNWVELYAGKDVNWIKLPDNKLSEAQYKQLRKYIQLTLVNNDSFIIFTNGYKHHTIEENKIHADGEIVETIIWFIKFFYQFGLLFTSMDEAKLNNKLEIKEK